MVRALARKKLTGRKPSKAVLSGKKVGAESKAVLSSSHGKPISNSKLSSKRAKAKNALRAQDEASQHAKIPVHKESTIMEAESSKTILASNITPTPGVPPRLLRETKTTAAALALLEKGIRLIYDRDLKRARVELRTLLDTYPGETEILARARSYIQICDREETSHKKPVVTNDQIYTLGVMEHNKANYEAAISYFHQSLENHRDADYIYYSLAASMALKGDFHDAIDNLRKAIELNEASRIHAKNDADFFSLQTQKEFADLIGLNRLSTNDP
jgi:tetratricopeptide (TPR) repeat protein